MISKSNPMKKLKGFVKEETIKKYFLRNEKMAIKKSKYNIKRLFIYLCLFCGILLSIHFFTLWCQYKKNPDKKETFNIVPLAGRY